MPVQIKPKSFESSRDPFFKLGRPRVYVIILESYHFSLLHFLKDEVVVLPCMFIYIYIFLIAFVVSLMKCVLP